MGPRCPGALRVRNLGRSWVPMMALPGVGWGPWQGPAHEGYRAARSIPISLRDREPFQGELWGQGQPRSVEGDSWVPKALRGL